MIKKRISIPAISKARSGNSMMKTTQQFYHKYFGLCCERSMDKSSAILF